MRDKNLNSKLNQTIVNMCKNAIITVLGFALVMTLSLPTLAKSPKMGVTLTAPQIMTVMQIKLERAVSADQILGFKRIVTRLDLDKDGKLSFKEWTEHHSAPNSHFYNNPAGINGFFVGADLNGDGFMTSDEYAWQRIITDEAKRIYFAWDKNRDRRVTQDEFLRNVVVRDEIIAEYIFRRLDTNSNGALNLPEYLRVWVGWVHTGRHLGSLD